jgi:hypothetical protein
MKFAAANQDMINDNKILHITSNYFKLLPSGASAVWQFAEGLAWHEHQLYSYLMAKGVGKCLGKAHCDIRAENWPLFGKPTQLSMTTKTHFVSVACLLPP